jgi:hypothetical protein
MLMHAALAPAAAVANSRHEAPARMLRSSMNPAGVALRAAFVANAFRGALPPVDLLAVCLVRAMIGLCVRWNSRLRHLFVFKVTYLFSKLKILAQKRLRLSQSRLLGVLGKQRHLTERVGVRSWFAKKFQESR